jgi:Rrf2 family iron-sulfur cluster assembly transcriptional regulator
MERLAAASIRRPGSSRSLSVLAGETGMSGPALEQVVHFLRLARLLEASRDQSTAVRLTRPASQISLLAVVRAIDGAGLWGRCILGLQECSDAAPCPAHPVWKKARAMLEQHLDSQSLVDLTRAVARRRRAGNRSEPRF